MLSHLTSYSCQKSQCGSMLIALIAIMVILGIISVFLVSFSSTSTFGHLETVASSKSMYLAKSGYKYLAGQYRHEANKTEKNKRLKELHDTEYVLADNQGRFALQVYPYFYMHSGNQTKTNGDNLSATFSGKIPDDYDIPEQGTLAYFKGSDGNYVLITYEDVEISQGTENILFSNVDLDDGSNDPTISVNIPSGSSLRPLYTQATPSGTVNEGDSIQVPGANATFPKRWGMFIVDEDGDGYISSDENDNNTENKIYKYDTRNGDQFQDIVMLNPNESFESFSLGGNSKIIQHTSAYIRSIGTSLEDRASSNFSRIVALGFGFKSDGYAQYPSGNNEDEFYEDFEEDWSEIEGKASVKHGGPAGHEQAVNLQGQESLIVLSWNEISELSDYISPIGEPLSYEIQVKIKADIEGGKGEYYLFGISFRSNDDDNSSYGLSFFKSYDDIALEPASLDDMLSGFKNEGPYIILWKKNDGKFKLIDSKKLDNDNVIENKKITGGGQPHYEDCLRHWSTLVVKLEEEYKENSLTNHIYAYIQGPDNYERNTISWDYTNFIEVAWNSSTPPIIDSTFTSNNIGQERPNEIGLHGFYDSPAANDQFFDDFSFRLEGDDTGVPGI